MLSGDRVEGGARLDVLRDPGRSDVEDVEGGKPGGQRHVLQSQQSAASE
jgi:hypothetical protein